MDPISVQNQLISITGPDRIDGMRFVETPADPKGKQLADGVSFSQMLAESIDQVNQAQSAADEGMKKIAAGETAIRNAAPLATERLPSRISASL